MDQQLAEQFSLEGRVAVVTGAASGIGRGVAAVLARAGASIVAADLNAAGLADTASAIGNNRVSTRRTDVTERDDVEALADHATSVFGGIDIWVNTAGIMITGMIVDATPDEFRRMMDVNLAGSYWGCAAAGRRMAERGRGSIINFSSSGADMPAPTLSLYAISKAGVNMLTRTAAAEFGPRGVRVNAVAPGFVDTPMVSFRYRDAAGSVDDAKHEDLLRVRAEQSALGLIATPTDIAYGVLFLASDASRHVAGQIYRVNGGATMP